MKNKTLEKLLLETPVTWNEETREVEINIQYKYGYIISTVNEENDKYDIDSNIRLTELQEDNIISYMIKEWNEKSYDWDNPVGVSEDDRINAMEVIFKHVKGC